MGLDIYAGTMTRYYAHNWKTVTEQWAEENGYTFHRITPGGDGISDNETISPAEIQAGIKNWQEQMLSAITQPGQKPYAPWAEDNEKPYYTDKPDWDAFVAMLLVAACLVYGEPIPDTVEKDQLFLDHPFIERLSEDQEKVWSLFRGASCWIPLSDSFLFQAPMPNGNQTVIATTAALRRELEWLNEMAWQAEEVTILHWGKTEGYPTDGSIDAGGAVTMEAEHSRYDTQSLAKYAFSLLYQALKFAEENQVPVLLDY